MRYAIYFTPPAGDTLTYRAARWLGRNAFTGANIEAEPAGRLSASDIAHYTAAPRRYGFHATLKAPFELADSASEADLLRAMLHFCGTADPIVIPRLRVTRVGSFFALTPREDCVGLNMLASRVVAEFERFRSPLNEADIELRNPEGLTSAQLANLYRWGYPYVFDDFRFHMTLTGPVGGAEADSVQSVLEDVFEPALRQPVTVGSVGLFVETTPGAPFTVHSLHPLGAVMRRKSA